ncbi:MAG: PLP-dependent aminotransferase family protein, partial [Gammaproteobacteria bacterium]
VEDDYDSDFRHHGSPLTAVAGQDRHGCVIYMGTFSKSIGAGLRLGYLVVPSELVNPAQTVKTLMDNGHSWLDQAVLADFISSGSYAQHLRRIRHTYLNRRDCLVNSLHKYFGDVQLSGLDGGMHVVWHLPTYLPSAEEVQNIAQETGVGVYAMAAAAAHDFGHKEYSERNLVLGYSSVSEKHIHEGISRLASALEKTSRGD